MKDFARQLTAKAKENAAALTLILNGDVFDLWEMVDPAQLAKTGDLFPAITKGLFVPTCTPEELAHLAGNVRTRLSESLAAHPEFPEFLNTDLDD